MNDSDIHTIVFTKDFHYFALPTDKHQGSLQLSSKYIWKSCPAKIEKKQSITGKSTVGCYFHLSMNPQD